MTHQSARGVRSDEQPERLTLRQRIWAWWKRRQVPVYRAALDEVQRLMNDDHFNEWTPDKARVGFTNRILVGLTACLQSPNAVLANRELLCEELLLCAHYGVLLIPAAPETDSAGLRGQLGVTGELRSHLQDALRLSDQVKDQAGNMGVDIEGLDADEFYYICYAGYLVTQSTILVLDLVRRELNDFVAAPGRDWLMPTQAALYAWEEHLHRQRLGLPEAERMDTMIALSGSTILNIIREAPQQNLWVIEPIGG